MGVFDITMPGRTPIQTSTKFGVYHASLKNGRVERGTSLKLYYEGVCTTEKVHDEVLPHIQERMAAGGWNYRPPFCIQRYISKSPGLSQWSHGKTRKPDPHSKVMQFFIDGDFQVHTVNENGQLRD